MSTPRIRVPAAAKAGEIVEVRTLIDHPMETGLRRDARGQPIPRNMLSRFTASLDGEQVFAARFANGTAANPALTFHVRIEKAAELVSTWTGDNGQALARTRTPIRLSS